MKLQDRRKSEQTGKACRNNRKKVEKKAYLEAKHEITAWDREVFKSLISVELTENQISAVLSPEIVFPRQKNVLAIHWHPETVPLDLIQQRLELLYPNKEKALVIPTQHNELLSYGRFSGVEIDCYAREFNLKIQLLLHFEKSRAESADTLKAVLAHTFKYRSTQLFDFIDLIIDQKRENLLREAVHETGCGSEVVNFTKIYVTKLKNLIEMHYAEIPPIALKNKLLRFYFQHLREYFEDKLVDRAQVLLNAVKKIMKRNFKLDYFYEVQEIIEEVRGIGGGIIVPHPEQFWPVLLADYDVDGYEVWNPQSREFTDFLINVVRRKNETRSYRERPLLVTMGDDCHLGDIIAPQLYKREEKKVREVGYQEAWEDFAVKKNLIMGGFTIEKIIEEYRQRLLG